MMAEMIPGHTAAEVEVTAEAFRTVMHGEPAPAGVELGDLEALEGVRKFAVRVKCAMLPWVTLTDALKSWRSGRAEATSITEAQEAKR
jgi:nitrogen fixation NifU-like protein